MDSERRTIDAWMQHPTSRFLQQSLFDPVRRWARSGKLSSDVPLELAATIRPVDEGGIRIGLLSAQWGPQGSLIDNDAVAGFVRRYPDRLVGIASVDLSRPMDAIRELQGL